MGFRRRPPPRRCARGVPRGGRLPWRRLPEAAPVVRVHAERPARRPVRPDRRRGRRTVVFHVGPEPSPLDSRWSEPRLLADVARRYPDVRFLAAHCGNEAWRETLDAVRDLNNVSIDLSGWQVRFAQDAGRFYEDVSEVLDALGAERVMWGTDPPYYRPLVPDSRWLAAFTEAPDGTFATEEVDMITGANAVSFFGLEP
ncbi:MAG TPA: amidohydrolase family protein [Actinomycetota bacterium]|nr:amidohydrolase family protein [Actinomycetota bacterium]